MGISTQPLPLDRNTLLTNSSILNPLPSTSTLTSYFKDSMCYISWSLPIFSFYSFKGFLKSSYH